MSCISNKCFRGPLPTTASDEDLYSFFLKEIYNGNLTIEGSKIKVFTTPVVDSKMQGYFHLTTKMQKQFGISIRMQEPRAYFINYVPIMIKNYKNCDTCDEIECNKIKIWTAPYKSTKRVKLLYYDDNNSYLIVLERKKNDLYIVTSFLIDEPHYLKKVLTEYKKNKKTFQK